MGTQDQAHPPDLGSRFDGMPDGNPHEMSDFDLARAACARAFLGRPALLLLESPLDAESADALVGPLRAVLDPALGAGAAALWVTRSPPNCRRCPTAFSGSIKRRIRWPSGMLPGRWSFKARFRSRSG